MRRLGLSFPWVPLCVAVPNPSLLPRPSLSSAEVGVSGQTGTTPQRGLSSAPAQRRATSEVRGCGSPELEE